MSEDERLCEDCKKVEGSFACKIRHQGQPIIRWGKASQRGGSSDERP